jgi:hypothetical protein
MKTLSDHTIIYDDECPMCRMYSKAFVKSGMLDASGRKAYTDIIKCEIPNIDWNRARNEIAMFNRNDHTVKYGVDSVLTIIEHRLPRLKPVFRFKPLYFFFEQLYFFISYNRKAIAPGKTFEGIDTCTPSMNLPYRWAYIAFIWLVTSYILVHYFRLGAPLVPESGFVREFSVCAGQLIFQGIFVSLFNKRRLVHYFGNVMTVSFAGALALSPMFLLTSLIKSNWFYIGYFMIVVCAMFFEHKRRVNILELPLLISFTWVIYRLLILYFVIL